ncbi:MAG: inner-membrane translocator [Thermodesulfobacteriota bacterium]
MDNARRIFGFVLLLALYLLASYRYFPGRPLDSLAATGLHLLRSAPFTVGLTLVTISLVQRLAREKLPWPRRFRFFLTISLCYEFLFALYHYLGMAQIGA